MSKWESRFSSEKREPRGDNLRTISRVQAKYKMKAGGLVDEIEAVVLRSRMKVSDFMAWVRYTGLGGWMNGISPEEQVE